jgi:NADPH:quinone reductase-like Zn-dependent oxidoreductase
MAAAVLAKRRGLTVLSTTRNESKIGALEDIGVDHPLVDDGDVASQVHRRLGAGVDAALELVGTPTLPDTLRATRVHGVVCFTGMLSNQWTIEEFYPIAYLPRGVRLTAYGGGAKDLPPAVLSEFLAAVERGEATVPIGGVFEMSQISEAHQMMEDAAVAGKLVVVNRHPR